jgi:DNA-binding transcriptional MerR regulator
LNINEAEKLTGIPRASIRYYESEGLISPARASNGYRVYCDDDIGRLNKIMLLRSLGISIEDIRRCDSEPEAFADVLKRRLKGIEDEKGVIAREKAVIEELIDAGVQYGDLCEDIVPEPVEEKLPPRPGVLRRYFARWTDTLIYSTLALVFSFFVIRTRVMISSDHAILRTLLSIVMTDAAFLIIEPLLVHFFGTTVGKWLFCISVTGKKGEKLTYTEAFQRTLCVLTYVEGLNIPILRQIGLYAAYKEDEAGRGQSYDDFSTQRTEDSHPWRQTLVVLPAAAAIFIAVTLSGALLPPPNTGALTLAQFVENYNYYSGSHIKLTQELGWRNENNPGHFYIEISDTRPEISVIEEGGKIRSVTVRYASEPNEMFSRPMALSYAQNAAKAVIMAQRGAFYDPIGVKNALRHFDSAMLNPFSVQYGDTILVMKITSDVPEYYQKNNIIMSSEVFSYKFIVSLG